jgi:hypothetical protein
MASPYWPLSLTAAATGIECSPVIFGTGADPGHLEHRSPSTRLLTDASG